MPDIILLCTLTVCNPEQIQLLIFQYLKAQILSKVTFQLFLQRTKNRSEEILLKVHFSYGLCIWEGFVAFLIGLQKHMTEHFYFQCFVSAITKD